MAILEVLFALKGVVSGAAGLVEAKTEIDRKAAIDEARAHMQRLEDEARAEQAKAKREGDTMRETEAKARLARLGALKRRTNLRRLAAQVDRSHERWRDEKREAYFTDWLGGKIFGRLGGMFQGNTKVVVEEGGKMGFSANPSKGGIKVNTEALLASIIEETESYHPLPGELGEYLAREAYRKVLRDNPQLNHEDRGEVQTFLCTQAQKDLDRLMRQVMSNDDVEAVSAAREQLCSQQYASGTLDAQGTLKDAHPLLTQRQVRLHYTQGGAVSGTFELKLEANAQRLAELADAIGEAAGSAAAGSLGSSSKKKAGPVEVPKELKGCKLTGKFTFALEGSHDGDTSMSGAVTGTDGDEIKLSCPGKTKTLQRGELVKGKMSWSGTDRGADIAVTVTLGEHVFKGNIPSGRGKPPE